MLRALLLALALAQAPSLDPAKSGGGGSAVDTQPFTGVPGTYTWTKPPSASATSRTCVIYCGPGGAGGSGGYAGSDAGGGGGAAGTDGWACWKTSTLNATEDVVITQATGGVSKSTTGNGNAGSNPGPSSFGAAARNLLELDPPAVISGDGGDTGSGVAGSGNISTYTLTNATMMVNGSAGGAGDDTGAGAAGTPINHDGSYTAVMASVTPFGILLPPTAGGGGGGHNGGASDTDGGVSGYLLAAVGPYFYLPIAAGTTNGAAGTDGIVGGQDIVQTGTNITSPAAFMCGSGGGGGAGGVDGTQDGGRGGDATCGGGGGGGGSSESGATGSGRGGNGGAACFWVITEL